MDATAIHIWAVKIGAGLGVALLFSLAIFIHELGHFLAARWMGLTVDAFSIGFGPAIWKRRIGEVEYRVSAIPFGGYVSLPQMDPSGMERIQGKHGAAQEQGEGKGGAESNEACYEASAAPASGKTEADGGKKPKVRLLADVAPWRRIIVSIAGPLGNIILATLLAWIVYLSPQAGVGGGQTTIGQVAPESAAFAAGLRAGDIVKSVNHAKVANWNEFIIECYLSGDLEKSLKLTVERDGSEMRLQIPVARDPQTKLTGIEGIAPRIPCIVGKVEAGTAAAEAGLLRYDVVLSINGQHPMNQNDMVELLQKGGGTAQQLIVQRKNEKIELNITPVFNEKLGRYMIGIVFGETFTPSWMQYRNPMRQISNDAKSVVRILQALFVPRTHGEAKRAAEGLSGPLVIVVLLWYQMMSGLVVALAFLRLLCINLALLNLLPLPVLDGGHIVFALWEMITSRKPRPAVVAWMANAFAVLLIGLMVLLFFRDAFNLSRMFKRPSDEGASPAVVTTNGTDSAVSDLVDDEK